METGPKKTALLGVCSDEKDDESKHHGPAYEQSNEGFEASCAGARRYIIEETSNILLRHQGFVCLYVCLCGI